MKYVLGVDGGGSKTHALILDLNGRVRGFGSAGCGNHQVHGLKAAVAEIEDAAKKALAQAGLTPQEIQEGCFCLSGADLPEDYRLLTPTIQALGLAQAFVIKNDTLAALRASITRSWGVVVICGSGFNAAARSPAGEEIVLPGLGFISGDWGGGGQLGHEMIRLVMRAWDGRGEKTLLTDLVLENLGLSSEEELLNSLYHEKISFRALLHLVPLLFKAAGAGDEVARKLIIQFGEEAAVTANALIKRLALQSTDVEVGLAGGVFKGEGPLLIDTIQENIHSLAPRARIRRTQYEPVVGAALLAIERTGSTAGESLYQALDQTVPASLRYGYKGSSDRRISSAEGPNGG